VEFCGFVSGAEPEKLFCSGFKRWVYKTVSPSFIPKTELRLTEYFFDSRLPNVSLFAYLYND